MDTYHVLVIDDAKEIVDLIEIYLSKEGYRVWKAFNGSEGLKIMDQNIIHLVILDIMMPEMDGIEACRRIREKGNIPIIMLSAKSQDMDKILGLGIGADDYMVKPFNPMELLARVNAQLRRYFYLNTQKLEKEEECIEIKGICIQRKHHTVTVNGEAISLTPTEFQILLLLAEHAGTVFNAEEIFERVWKEKYYDSNNTVMVHIWKLREKIEGNPKKPNIIETVWGVGYKIEKI
jgi:Response regulators consisting of a CheY-like receiver domain and a winged-helix DNA-binding domain